MNYLTKSNNNANGFYYPQIETERLLLRMFEPKDLDAAFVLFNDAEVQKYLSPQNQRNREQLKILLEKCLKYWEERGFGVWCVTEKNAGKMIGYCGFQYFDKTTEIAIVFGYLKEYWGKGFATEAAEECLKFGFEKLSFKKIYAVTDPDNLASLHVLEKVRMLLCEKIVHYEMNTVTYAILKNECQSFIQCHQKAIN